VYDVFAHLFKRFRVIITIDFRFHAKKTSCVDAQNRVSLEIAFDLNFVETKKKKVKKKKKTRRKRSRKRKKMKKIKKRKKNDEIDDDDEENDDVDVRVVQITVNKSLEVQIFVIIDKQSSFHRFVKK
jgi:hypothetical protein